MNFCKCIVRTDTVLKLGIHCSKLYSNITTDSNNKSIEKLPFIPCNENILKSQHLHLNHYAIRSFDWFTRVKMTRGSANSQGAANSKSRIAYFKEFDAVSNDIDDFELKKKNINLELSQL